MELSIAVTSSADRSAIQTPAAIEHSDLSLQGDPATIVSLETP